MPIDTSAPSPATPPTSTTALSGVLTSLSGLPGVSGLLQKLTNLFAVAMNALMNKDTGVTVAKAINSQLTPMSEKIDTNTNGVIEAAEVATLLSDKEKLNELLNSLPGNSGRKVAALLLEFQQNIAASPDGISPQKAQEVSEKINAALAKGVNIPQELSTALPALKGFVDTFHVLITSVHLPDAEQLKAAGAFSPDVVAMLEEKATKSTTIPALPDDGLASLAPPSTPLALDSSPAAPGVAV